VLGILIAIRLAGELSMSSDTDELVGGNGLMEMGTFLAILVGTLLGGLLIANERYGAWMVASAVIVVAVIAGLSAHKMPPAPAAEASLVVRWNISHCTYQGRSGGDGPGLEVL
jgi:hypothetical protein